MRCGGLLLLGLLAALQPARAFKEQDFKVGPLNGAGCSWVAAHARRASHGAVIANVYTVCTPRVQKCATASFCARNRNTPQGSYFEVAPASVGLNVATLSATLVNTLYSKHLLLTITSHADGFLRVTVDETPSVGRYQVPSDILVSGWENRKAAFAETSRSASSIVLASGDSVLTLNFKPFTLSLTVKGLPALTLNSKNLFNFEHRRTKQVRGPGHGYRRTRSH